jgi:phage-related protein
MGRSKKDLRALPAAVVVLHVFQKKSKSGIGTPKPDMELIEDRLKRATALMKDGKA